MTTTMMVAYVQQFRHDASAGVCWPGRTVRLDYGVISESGALIIMSTFRLATNRIQSPCLHEQIHCWKCSVLRTYNTHNERTMFEHIFHMHIGMNVVLMATATAFVSDKSIHPANMRL